MVNQLAKFLPDLATVTAPLRPLLSCKNAWTWEAVHSATYARVKQVKQALVKYWFCMIRHDPSKLVGLVYWGLTPQQQPGSYQGGEVPSADSSPYGVGAVLLLKVKDVGRPVAYALRSLTPVELEEHQGRTQDFRRGVPRGGEGVPRGGGGVPRSAKEANNPNKRATELKPRTYAHQGSMFRP